jgi:hypothetical protein
MDYITRGAQRVPAILLDVKKRRLAKASLLIVTCSLPLFAADSV